MIWMGRAWEKSTRFVSWLPVEISPDDFILGLTNVNMIAFSNFKSIALCIVAREGFLRGVSFRRFYLGMLPTNCIH